MGLANKIQSASNADMRAPTLPDGPPPSLPQATYYPPAQTASAPPAPSALPPQTTFSPPSGNKFGGNEQPAVRERLNRIVAENQLQAFYPSHKLDAMVARASAIDYDALAQKWKMPKELAYDLASLALYDVVLYCDDSGSMIFEESGERIDDLKLIVSKVAEVATLFDHDGIAVRFMNSSQQGNSVRSKNEAEDLVKSVKFGGVTPIGTNLQNKVIAPLVLDGLRRGTLEKPVLIIIITDGEPSGEPRDTLSNVIGRTLDECIRSRYGERAVGYQIAQVGKDSRAQAFLATIDNHPRIGHLVDATSYFELEYEEMVKKGVELTPEMWLVKMMLGGIDKSYDEADE